MTSWNNWSRYLGLVLHVRYLIVGSRASRLSSRPYPTKRSTDSWIVKQMPRSGGRPMETEKWCKILAFNREIGLGKRGWTREASGQQHRVWSMGAMQHNHSWPGGKRDVLLDRCNYSSIMHANTRKHKWMEPDVQLTPPASFLKLDGPCLSSTCSRGGQLPKSAEEAVIPVP